MQKWVESEEKRQQSPSSGGCLVNNTSNTTTQEPLLISPIKNLKLEFPRFQGEDPTCWVYRANQFFSYHNTPEHHRVIMALYHLDGEALIWFQDAEQVGGFASWEVFVKAVQIRFGVTAYDDPMEALTRLKQVSSVVAYKGNFEILSNRVTRLFESHKLSCFLSGLKDEIRLQVRMLVPKSLNEAFGLAKIQEEYLLSSRRGFGNVADSWKASILGLPPKFEAKAESRIKVPLQRLSSAQTEERRKQGLCYNCDEKWQVGHKCKGAKLFLLEGLTMEVNSKPPGIQLVEMNEDEVVLGPQDGGVDNSVEITLYVLIGSPSSNTMMVKGKIKNQEVVSLIDSGSPHNFLDVLCCLLYRYNLIPLRY